MNADRHKVILDANSRMLRQFENMKSVIETMPEGETRQVLTDNLERCCQELAIIGFAMIADAEEQIAKLVKKH